MKIPPSRALSGVADYTYFRPPGDKILDISNGKAIAIAVGMDPKAKALQERTHRFFVDVITYTRTVPASTESDEIVPQLLASAGSADSNYRACCKARSKKEFIAKVGLAAEEADEALGWLTALRDAGLGDATQVGKLIQESDELTSIFVKSGATAARNLAAAEAKRKMLRRR